jgi:hypothetical protein
MPSLLLRVVAMISSALYHWQKNSLDKVVPQHTRWVLQHPDKGGDFDLVIFNSSSSLASLCVWRV